MVRVHGDRPRLQWLNEFNGAFDPLHFVLLFPHGELGWTPDIQSSRVRSSIQLPLRPVRMQKPAGGVVTLREYASYYLMERKSPSHDYLHLCGPLPGSLPDMPFISKSAWGVQTVT